MSKREILEDIYPDELPAIFSEMKNEELKRYQGYYNELVAGIIGHTKENDNTVNNYINSVVETIKKLNEEEKVEDTTPATPEEIKERLGAFTGVISKTRG